eukprot:1256111-Pyramimonas_sp.AAC.1
MAFLLGPHPSLHLGHPNETASWAPTISRTRDMDCRNRPLICLDLARSLFNLGILLGSILTTSGCSDVHGWHGNAA